IRNLKLSSETDPTNHLAWFNLGIVYKDMHRWDPAAEAFKEAAKLQDSNASYHYEEANAYYEAALEIKKIDANKHAKLTPAEQEKAFAQVGPKLDQAKAGFEAALKYQSTYRAHYRLGTVLELQEKYKDADAEYRKAIEVNPRFPDSFIRLGNLYLDHDY